MGRTLIIKGANFETNRVVHVTYSGIPCVSISLDDDSYEVSSAFDGFVITKSPADTTDDVILSIADQTVAYIADGKIIPVGFGTTTLNVVCGSASAQATITVPYIDVALTKFELRRTVAANWGGSKNPIVFDNNSSYDSYALPYTAGRANGIYNGSNPYVSVVVDIPSLTDKFTIHYPNNPGNYGNIRFTSISAPYSTQLAKYISTESFNDTNSDGVSNNISVVSGADSFAIEAAKTTVADNVFVRFYPAS